MLTPASATHDFSEFIAREVTAGADNPVLWSHLEQVEPLECSYQNAYFDVIMRVRRHRPFRHLRPLTRCRLSEFG
jgi:hypothetical protein